MKASTMCLSAKSSDKGASCVLVADVARATRVGKDVGWNIIEGVFVVVGKYKCGDHC